MSGSSLRLVGSCTYNLPFFDLPLPHRGQPLAVRRKDSVGTLGVWEVGTKELGEVILMPNTV
jgi:hypothetical protein